jgi:hypothetical protein
MQIVIFSVDDIIVFDGKVTKLALTKTTGQTFASIGMDNFVNVWSIGSRNPSFLTVPFHLTFLTLNFDSSENLIAI